MFWSSIVPFTAHEQCSLLISQRVSTGLIIPFFSGLVFFDIDTVLINWIRAFFAERSQAESIGNSLSNWKSPRGGIPQGTKLGVIYLFAAMTNTLLRELHLKFKFVDDTTALEILPRNDISLQILLSMTFTNFL